MGRERGGVCVHGRERERERERQRERERLLRTVNEKSPKTKATFFAANDCPAAAAAAKKFQLKLIFCFSCPLFCFFQPLFGVGVGVGVDVSSDARTCRRTPKVDQMDPLDPSWQGS